MSFGRQFLWNSPRITFSHYHQARGWGWWWWGCMRGCEYEGITRWGWGICCSVEGCCWPLAPPVHGLPSLTRTGTATLRGDGRVVTPGPTWPPWGSWSPFSCCARFVLYRWFWNQIFTCGNTRHRFSQLSLKSLDNHRPRAFATFSNLGRVQSFQVWNFSWLRNKSKSHIKSFKNKHAWTYSVCHCPIPEDDRLKDLN